MFREYKFNNNYFRLTSLEEATSTDFIYIWMEEAEEFNYEDYTTLKTRLSRKKKDGEINQMFLSYNPKKKFGNINKRMNTEKDIELIKSSYENISTLSKEYVKLLESLKEQSTNFCKIFTLGKYASTGEFIFLEI